MAEVLPFHAILFRPGAPELPRWTAAAVEPLSRFGARAPAYRLVADGAPAAAPGPVGARAALDRALDPRLEPVIEPALEPALGPALGSSFGPAAGDPFVSSADDVLFVDETKGFFVYRHEFRTEGGLEKTRLGLMGILDPEGDGAAQVFTTLDTEPFGVERCAEELAESGIQGSPLIAAVEDLKFDLEKLLERGILLREGPDIQLELPDGDRHRLWKIEEPELLAEIAAFFRGKDCFLIDGLHAYRALRRAPGDRPSRPLALFFNLFDFGVSLSAASVLLGEIPGFKINEIALRLNAFFEIKTFPFDSPANLPRALADFREDLRIRGFTDSVVGACFGGVDHFFLFQLREDADRDKVFLPDVKAPLRDFDSILLRRAILERYLGAGGPGAEPLEYCWSVEESIAAVRSGKFRAVFFLNPPNKRRLLTLARSGLRLPPGSARLDPPVRSRLVMSRAAPAPGGR